MKKILALVLSVAMLLSLTAAVAEEAGFEETPIKLDGSNPESAEEVDLEEAPLHAGIVLLSEES
jgi:hypothetical protein